MELELKQPLNHQRFFLNVHECPVRPDTRSPDGQSLSESVSGQIREENIIMSGVMLC